IGQDIWQRVFTARTPGVARLGGTAAGIYCILFGVAGAILGMAAAILLPNIEDRDDVFASVALEVLPVGIGGIALAAGVAAMMSTASGGLIAAATVVQADVIPLLKGMAEKRGPRKLTPIEVVKVADASAARAEQAEEDVNTNR